MDALEAATTAVSTELSDIKARVGRVSARTEALSQVGSSTPSREPMKSSAKKRTEISPAVDESHVPEGWTPSDMAHPFTMLSRVVVKSLLAAGTYAIGAEIVVGGWVKTGRKQGKGAFCFLEVNDGSCAGSIQVVVQNEVYDVTKLIATGTSVLVKGTVIASPGGSQPIEVQCTEVLYVGPCDTQTYPLPKTKLSLENLRNIIHFRSRTNTIQAVFRIRNTLAAATHEFFQEKGFLYLHAPIITQSDCEGAGEMFQVTTLLGKADNTPPPPSETDIAAADKSIEDQGNLIRTMKEEKADKKKIKAEVDVLNELKKARAGLQESIDTALGKGFARTPDGKIDYTKDFFAKPAMMTVSGQLDAEIYACSMTSVYTFGPTFRAEYSHTTRHLAEFWMIEPEIAFCEIEGNIRCAEAYVQYCSKKVLEDCRKDLEFLAKNYDPTCIDRLERVVATPFNRITYTDAISLLLEHVAAGKKSFDVAVEWGMDMGSEHERYLAEEVFKGPVVVYNYPKAIKSFYMRENDPGTDGREEATVAAMDVLIPKVGELIGGSQREERPEKLAERIAEGGLPAENYEWYMDLRKFGTVPHSGFGLGFERLVLFATGMENIRDVIPFPRFPGKIL